MQAAERSWHAAQRRADAVAAQREAAMQRQLQELSDGEREAAQAVRWRLGSSEKRLAALQAREAALVHSEAQSSRAIRRLQKALDCSLLQRDLQRATEAAKAAASRAAACEVSQEPLRAAQLPRLR
jgi:hypothetical protein